MSTVPLPDEPSLEQLRKQARELQRAVRAGDPAARAELAERHPRPPQGADALAAVPLSTAQLVVARRHGFDSWVRLRDHVEVVRRYTRFPARMAAGEPVDLADRFLRLACLDYDAVGPEQWTEARRLLAEHPEITEGNIHAASVAGDVAAVGRVLAADPAAAIREGGPYRWTPIFSLAYARHDPDIPEESVLGAARLLLDAGADPDAGFLWHGQLTPFTILTGVFGEGEQGPILHPRHPHSLALGRRLLEAGAEPNDGQVLYNRMFGADDGHLELLFEFGLGAGDGGPWRRRLGAAVETPAALVRRQLHWAILHGMTSRVQLLADHGVDLVNPFADGRTPAALAATTGDRELSDYLVGRGAPPPALEPGEAFVAAVLAPDRAAVEQLRIEHPGLLEKIRTRRPGLMAWAAATRGADAVELLVDLGFDIDAKGRTDGPSNQPWQTALHAAVENDDLDLARTLLRLGAHPEVRDGRFDSTPLGWAHHLGRPRLVELLEPVTTTTTTTDAAADLTAQPDDAVEDG